MSQVVPALLSTSRALGISLLAFLCAFPCLAAKDPIPPEISKEGWPHVEILAPHQGAILTGSVRLKWQGETPAGFGGIEIRVDQRRVFQFQEPTWERTLDTTFLDEGEHQLEIRLMDVDRRRGFANVVFQVRKPQFALLSAAHRDKGVVANGQNVVVEVTASGKEFDPQADFSALDSEFDPTKVRWREVSEGIFEASYRISDTNRRPDGNYRVGILLTDQQAPQIEQRKQLLVELQNVPLASARGARPVDIPCAVFRPEALPPTFAQEAPFAISGPSEVRVGETTQLSLEWQPSEDSARRFLRVSVDGIFGYFVLLGTCGAGDGVTVEALQVGDRPFRLAFWPEEGLPVVHELRVHP